jgi:DNA polymerase elongation subunit (family B)
LDIETSPNSAYVWGLFDQNISINQMIDSSRTLCYSAKWLGEKEIKFDSEYKSKPKKMLKGIHELLNLADVVVTYNGNRFDLPILNKEFLLHGFAPPSPYKRVDLLRVVRSNFKFTSNKLDYISQQLGLGKKQEHEGFQLWLSCMKGDKDAWKRMESYNIQDVVLLESLYDTLRPWIKNHPNHNIFSEGAVCPNCSSTHLQKRGVAVSTTGSYQRYQCRDCGTWSQGTKSTRGRVEVKGIV